MEILFSDLQDICVAYNKYSLIKSLSTQLRNIFCMIDLCMRMELKKKKEEDKRIYIHKKLQNGLSQQRSTQREGVARMVSTPYFQSEDCEFESPKEQKGWKLLRTFKKREVLRVQPSNLQDIKFSTNIAKKVQKMNVKDIKILFSAFLTNLNPTPQYQKKPNLRKGFIQCVSRSSKMTPTLKNI